MDDYVYEIKQYLPLFYTNPDNEEYASYLETAYLKNNEAKTHQFSFMSFHLLYMSFIYKTVWFLRTHKFELFTSREQNNENFRNANTPFDLSVIPEKEIFGILHVLGFHRNRINDFASIVEKRNHCAHCSGFVQYRSDKIGSFISEILESIQSIYDKMKPHINECLKNMIINEDNVPPYYPLIDDFIRRNLFSVKEVESFLIFDFPELHAKSDNKRIINIKTAYLVLLGYIQRYIDINGNPFLEKFPFLLDGFDEQRTVDLDQLIKDEFSEIIIQFLESEQDKFDNLIF